ncbi:solute carrier family 2, facilitated glucose transporter member 12-like isoform X3 [Tachypleus tridentatus]|uniref:solute carrier family 2, facilitated glucose transporter member 12-like isoform X3 n=1 Tax=Tachypleus tridentatus TaxID=6853 RepID=UPI003FD498A3
MVIKMEEGNSDEDLPATLFSTCHFPKHLSTEDLPNRFVTTSLDVRDKNSGLSKMPRKFLLFAAVTASVGGVMFGYDVGIISGALLQLKLEFQLNCVWQELVVSSLLCGAFLASLVGGIIVDHYGRRMSMVFAGFLFITGSVLLCFSPTIFLVLVGRFVLGFSVSLSVTAECTYISELSTPKHRGMLVSLNEVGITFGFLLAFLVNYIFISVPQGWKYMFGLAAVPAVLQLVGIIFLPRSPHYLLMIGKKEEAAAVLNKVSPGEDTSKQIGSIQRDLSQQKMITYCQLCSSVNNMSVRMVIGMNLVFLQQVVAAIVSMLLIDKLGRRVILLTGVLVMTVSIWFLGFVLTFDPVHQVVIQCMETPVYHQFTLHNESEDNSTVLPAHFNVITPTLLPKTLIAQNVSLKKTLSLDLLDVYNSSGLPHNFVPAYMHLNHTVDTNSSPPNLPTKDQVFYETDINRDFLMVRQGYPIQAHLQTHQTVLPSLEKFCL